MDAKEGGREERKEKLDRGFRGSTMNERLSGFRFIPVVRVFYLLMTSPCSPAFKISEFIPVVRVFYLLMTSPCSLAVSSHRNFCQQRFAHSEVTCLVPQSISNHVPPSFSHYENPIPSTLLIPMLISQASTFRPPWICKSSTYQKKFLSTSRS